MLFRVDLLERIAAHEESSFDSLPRAERWRSFSGPNIYCQNHLEAPALVPGCTRWPIFDGKVARNSQ